MGTYFQILLNAIWSFILESLNPLHWCVFQSTPTEATCTSIDILRVIKQIVGIFWTPTTPCTCYSEFNYSVVLIVLSFFVIIMFMLMSSIMFSIKQTNNNRDMNNLVTIIYQEWDRNAKKTVDEMKISICGNFDKLYRQSSEKSKDLKYLANMLVCDVHKDVPAARACCTRGHGFMCIECAKNCRCKQALHIDGFAAFKTVP
jgi:hypothetical protein